MSTFASNAYRLQSLVTVAHKYGRKIAFTGRSMENILKVSTELGYMKLPPKTLVDINQIKSIPKDKLVIVATGSQGEDMSALYRMAYNSHRQVEIQPGDRVILSASAIPGNEKAIGNIINELYRKNADVVCDKLSEVHVSGHACQEELKIIHGLLKPRFFIPVHGEQRHLQIHAKLAVQAMGMDPRNVIISDLGRVIELTGRSCKLAGTVPAGRVLVDGSGVGDVGSVVLRDRKHLAQDGMLVVVVSLSSEDGSVLSGPDIITRGFVYVQGVGKPHGGAAQHRRGLPGEVPRPRNPGLGRHQGGYQVGFVQLPVQDHKAKPHDPSRHHGDLNLRRGNAWKEPAAKPG